MDNISALADKLKETNKNAYQKLQWINKGALALIPKGEEKFFDEVVAFLKADCKKDVTFIQESKKKYQQLKKKQS